MKILLCPWAILFNDVIAVTSRDRKTDSGWWRASGQQHGEQRNRFSSWAVFKLAASLCNIGLLFHVRAVILTCAML